MGGLGTRKARRRIEARVDYEDGADVERLFGGGRPLESELDSGQKICS